MKITTGKYKFKKINFIKYKELRPTSSKVRGAIFNILISQYGWENLSIRANLLDAFSGTGIITFESFSRNLKKATVIEYDTNIFNNLKKNIYDLKLCNKVTLINSNFFQVNLLENVFDIVYLDPPYSSNLTNLAINKILDERALKSNALIISETNNKYNYEKSFIKYINITKNYGSTSITFFKFN